MAQWQVGYPTISRAAQWPEKNGGGGYLLIPFFDKLMAGNSAGNEPWVFRSGEEVM